MLFTKSIVDKKAKLLYLMGATWHTKCMFDIDTVEPSFASLLAKFSIETYTFDYPGTGPVELDGRIGNRYQESIEIAKNIINQYKIEFIMGYSYGCILAQELSNCDNIRGVIMLDPQSEVYINKKVVGNDKIYISKNSVREALVGVGSTISDDILDDYINSLTDTDTLVTALYPGIVYGKEKESFLKKHINVPRQIFATKNISPEILNKFTNVISYPDASHWIMLEQSRYQLAKDVDTFITGLL